MPPDDETALLDIAIAARRIVQAIDGSDAYERVNLELIWNVARDDVVALQRYVEPLLPSDEGAG